jgi:adenosylcobyric acid synthase
VLGVYLHGLFEDAAVLERLFGADAGQRVRTLDVVFDGLADFAQAHFGPGVLDGLLQPRA